jgi:hypothetical protein
MRTSSYQVSGQFRSATFRIALLVAALAVLVSESRSDEVSTPPVTTPAVSPADALATPTHHQTGTIEVKVSGLTCFCVTPDSRVLAGCGETKKGYVCVYDPSGAYVESWELPLKPEAIFARGDGAIFVAGEGQLARLTPKGNLDLLHDAPHAAAISGSHDKIREEVIAENKQRAGMYAEQAKSYDQMLDQVQKQIDGINAKLAALNAESKEGADATASDKAAAEQPAESAPRRHFPGNKQSLERQLAMQEQMKKQYEQIKSQFAEMVKRNPDRELTEDEIEQQIKSSMQYKLKASSISATDNDVYLATHSATGYGFSVWTTDANFENGQAIISDLSGCCGQMDVKVSGDALYVAENSRHRVCHYDTSGKLVGSWGTASRTGIEGFGSCCNPMNVAFGPGGVIYTSEDDTGRIKRYTPAGELLGLVGAVDVPPGCKNVSIAATSDGSRFYMLDITNNRILKLDPYGPGETPKPMKFEDKQPAAVEQQDVQTSQASPSFGEVLIQAIFSPSK